MGGLLFGKNFQNTPMNVALLLRLTWCKAGDKASALQNLDFEPKNLFVHLDTRIEGKYGVSC